MGTGIQKGMVVHGFSDACGKQCLEHGKPRDIICIDCRQLICLKCYEGEGHCRRHDVRQKMDIMNTI